MTHLDFPLPFNTFAEAQEDFKTLANTDFTSLKKAGVWESRSEFSASQKIDTYLDTHRAGLVSSHFFHAAARYACDSLNSPSVIRGWYEPKIRNTLENSAFFEKSPKTALVLRKYLPSQFRPSAACSLMQMTQAQSYYDPCAGWGDRLTAAMACKIPKVFLRDVNPLAFAGYTQQVQNFCPPETEIRAELLGCENPTNLGNLDLIFTSPPYWKAEHYQGELQSFRKFKKFEAWLEGFLMVMVQNCLDSLAPTGLFALNVSDVYANHTHNRIVQPLIDTFHSQLDGVMGYRIAKRVGSQPTKEGVFCEPILLFRPKA